MSTGLIIWLAISIVATILNTLTERTGILSGVLTVSIGTLTIAGIVKQKANWLKAVFWLQIISGVVSAAVLIYGYFVSPDGFKQRFIDLDDPKTLRLFFTVIISLSLLSQAIFLYYLYRLYSFFERRDKALTPGSRV